MKRRKKDQEPKEKPIHFSCVTIPGAASAASFPSSAPSPSPPDPLQQGQEQDEQQNEEQQNTKKTRFLCTSQRKRRVCAFLAVCIVLGIGGRSGERLLFAHTALLRAKAGLDSLRQQGPELLTSDAQSAQAKTRLHTAEKDLRAAQDALSTSTGIWILRRLPVLKQNFRALDQMIEMAAVTANAGEKALGAIEKARLATEGDMLAMREGAVDMNPLSTALPGLQDALFLLETVAPAATALTQNPPVGPVGDAATQAARAFSSLQEDMRRAVASITLLPAMLGINVEETAQQQKGSDGRESPSEEDKGRRYLLALRNNAELRADGGMVLSTATLTAVNGKISITDAKSVGDTSQEKEDINIDVPSWYRLAYAPYGALQIFQNATMTAHFPTAASVMAALHERHTGMPVDGVITIDPVGLRPLLAVTGPVQAQGYEFTAENVTDLALNKLYLLNDRSKVRRRDLIAEVTATIFTQLTTEVWDERAMAHAVTTAVAGGNMQIWMKNPQEQALVAQLGAAGNFAESSGGFLQVAVQNTGGNKLDYFLQRSISHQIDLHLDGSATFSTTVEIKNPVIPAQPDYVVSPKALTHFGIHPGTHQAISGIYVPENARLTGWETPGSTPRVTREAGALSLSSWVLIAPGEKVSVTFHYAVDTFPQDWRQSLAFELVFQPQATITPDVIDILLRAPEEWKVTGNRTWHGRVHMHKTRTVQIPLTPPW